MGNGASATKPKAEPVRTDNTPQNSETSKGKIVGVDAGPVKGGTAAGGPPEGKTANAGPAEEKANNQKSSEEKVDLMGVIFFIFSILVHQFVFDYC